MSLTPERLTRLGRVAAIAPSPDGTWLAVAVARLVPEDDRYVHDLWRVPLDGGPAARLTSGESDDRAPSFRRDGALGFLSDRSEGGGPAPKGERRDQVWLLPPFGEATRLTDEPLGVRAFRFAAAADVLVAVAPVLPGVPHEAQRETAKERAERGPSARRYTDLPVRHWDHWLAEEAPHLVAYAADGAGRRDLTPEADRELREASWDLSTDGRLVAFGAATRAADGITDRRVRLVPTDGGAARDLPSAPRTEHGPMRFDPTGRFLASARERRHDGRCVTRDLVLLDVATGEARALATELDRWLEPAAFTPDGRHLVATCADRGAVPVLAVELETGVAHRLSDEASGGTHEQVALCRDGRTLVGLRSTLLHPPEVFRLPVEGGAPELLSRLSGFDLAEGAELADVSTFDTEARDGAPVQCWLVRPRAVSGPAPTLLWIHGGPISHFGDGWHWRWNALTAASAGYAVAMPNARGSTGFGHAFVEGIWGNAWGDLCFSDLMRVTDALEARDDVDEGRVMAMGGSFGGYMSNWIGGQTHRFRCLVTHASLFDLSAFSGTTDEPAWFALQLGAVPGDDPEGLDRYSPHRFVEGWRTPTLVIHGELDYRVPVGEGLALFTALRRAGVPSELLVFPDENHWILKPRNIRVWYDAVFDWIGRHMPPGPTEGEGR